MVVDDTRKKLLDRAYPDLLQLFISIIYLSIYSIIGLPTVYKT